jgi:hypothetical protein
VCFEVGDHRRASIIFDIKAMLEICKVIDSTFGDKDLFCNLNVEKLW